MVGKAARRARGPAASASQAVFPPARIFFFAILAALPTLACGRPAAGQAAGQEKGQAHSQGPGGFWAHWGDGKAELSGYALRIMRYGQPREGSLVLIFVTEDFSDSARVKADPGKHPPSDVYPVLKQNAMRKFQTGIYDYSTMTSAFVRVDNATPGGGPLRKLSFSSQEWCGHVYHQLLPAAGGRLVSTSHSYFDGEADEQRSLDWPAGAITEDELPLRLRSYAGQPDFVAPGERRSVPMAGSLLRVRLLHQPLSVGQATIERQHEPGSYKTPAGSFAVFTYVVTLSGLSGGAAGKSDRGVFHIEAAAPHRLVHYRWDSGEEATLLGSARLPYWQLNGNGAEALLRKLGLPGKVPGKEPEQTAEQAADQAADQAAEKTAIPVQPTPSMQPAGPAGPARPASTAPSPRR
jgi:hypothetical protein